MTNEAARQKPHGDGDGETSLAVKPHALFWEHEKLRLRIDELEYANRLLEEENAHLAHAAAVAASGNQSKSQFLATMSHELRTPLNAIIGFSEIIKAQLFGAIGDRYVSYAQNIHDSGSHLLALINDILDISKLDAGRLEIRDDSVDLAKVMVACIKLTETQAEKAKVHLVTSIAPELGFIRCDERRLRQIFLNLLSNAVKFTPEGGSVSLTAHLRDDGIAIVVSDSGIGIATHDIPTAFERFGQIDSTLSRKYEGTGLGLPLAKQLAELHGGSLELESEVGVGTVVTLLLPQTRLETQRKIA